MKKKKKKGTTQKKRKKKRTQEEGQKSQNCQEQTQTKVRKVRIVRLRGSVDSNKPLPGVNPASMGDERKCSLPGLNERPLLKLEPLLFLLYPSTDLRQMHFVVYTYVHVC
eukprot:GHVS01054102.1.p1 GENE.GHVS01054102.1~~GHVS01054102.1.p1  ORF type:complete len:110 (+),score=15.70 GHVS01054102.1:276-605(+)